MTASFTSPEQLRRDLRQAGLSSEAITAAWPQWWSESAVGSPSAEAELRFSLARKLGLSATSLLQNDPTFVLRGRASFKRASLTGQIDQLLLTTVGQSLGRLISEATITPHSELPSAASARAALRPESGFISLGDVLTLCWGIGIPVVSQSVFPLAAKRMDAMTVVADGRPVILLARRTKFPAFLSFMVAHELGHIALGHVSEVETIADFSGEAIQYGDYDLADERSDSDELGANAFALELLTGSPTFEVTTDRASFNASQAALAIQEMSPELGVDPGLVGLSLGRSTSRWAPIYAALKMIGHFDENLMSQINRIALRHLDESRIPGDSWDYLIRALGIPNDND